MNYIECCGMVKTAGWWQSVRDAVGGIGSGLRGIYDYASYRLLHPAEAVAKDINGAVDGVKSWVAPKQEAEETEADIREAAEKGIEQGTEEFGNYMATRNSPEFRQRQADYRKRKLELQGGQQQKAPGYRDYTSFRAGGGMA